MNALIEAATRTQAELNEQKNQIRSLIKFTIRMLGKVSCGNSESCSIDFFRQYNHLFEIQEFEHFIPIVELQKDLIKIAKNNKELAIKLCSYYPKLIDSFEFEVGSNL
jgi:hypothetical protein